MHEVVVMVWYVLNFIGQGQAQWVGCGSAGQAGCSLSPANYLGLYSLALWIASECEIPVHGFAHF